MDTKISQVRLSKGIITTICDIVKSRDVDSKIYLFGSRCDPNVKGGDIDLLIHTSILSKDDVNEMRWEILKRIGERKIDILISATLSESFVRLILPDAILLNE